MARGFVRAASLLLFFSVEAQADPSDPAYGHGVWRTRRAGSSLPDAATSATILDGVWSFGALNYNADLAGRTWDAPYPWGPLTRYTARLLHSLTWAAMLMGESQLVFLLMGSKYDWIADAAYRTEWIAPLDLPACPRPGAYGGCGLGIGSFSFLQVRPLRSKWWFEAGGGWFEQRVRDDALRTLAESTWVLTPLTALRDVHTDLDQPIAFRAFFGPGIFFGMHSAHLHPTWRGRELYDGRWSGLYPLDAGIGPGGRVEGRVILGQRLGFEAELTMAPFVLGGPTERVSADVTPLDFGREGVSVWRKAVVGIAWEDPKYIPWKTTLSAFAAELSDRPIALAGYRGVMLRFDVPLKVPVED